MGIVGARKRRTRKLRRREYGRVWYELRKRLKNDCLVLLLPLLLLLLEAFGCGGFGAGGGVLDAVADGFVDRALAFSGVRTWNREDLVPVPVPVVPVPVD